MKDFINNLNKVKKVAIFSTSALLKKTVFKNISKLLKKKRIEYCLDFYHSYGEYRNSHIGRPNKEDIDRAREFARKVVGE